MLTNALSKNLRVPRQLVCRAQRQARAQSTMQASSSQSTSASSSKAQQQAYLTSDRKRDLISIYHQCEKFVTYENLSGYIDKEFTFTPRTKRPELEAGRADLENLLADRRAGDKMTTNVDTSTYGRKPSDHKTPLRQMRERREQRLKAVLYGLDESMKTGLEAVKEFRATEEAHGKTSRRR